MDRRELEIDGYRRERGLLWPNYDTRCAEVTFKETVDNLDLIRRHVPAPAARVAVQAGGNCGQLVRGLAEMFETVHTFEPDPRNFVALTVNTAHMLSVVRFQAALDCERGRGVSMGDGDTRHAGANCGALYVAGEGEIPTMLLDDLALQVCDLIMLDVEGAELRALAGARDTIERCKPVVIFESKGLGAKFYGESPDAALIWLARRGYRIAERTRLDTVMVPV
jgi:FkbM family methyltransferase